ncbi:hypothetical protein MPH47_01820 [Psychrobacillus psychrodurans]|uniref:hypothetical protein n=1 Tax=Psychrobacillus psychrodurans TaxID=126157 RepID=UPI001F4E4CB6|nr:hypothetical protein [Psychrobacillus psychrodurans]MCK1995974.1 hypothetical protein [Psychrobacillus psychrodurans]
MLFINDFLVSEEKDKQVLLQDVKSYLTKQKLILINEKHEPMSEEEIKEKLYSMAGTLKLTATLISVILFEFKEELHNYIVKVQTYIEEIRENENYNSVTDSFIQVTEALLQFKAVSNYLHKELISEQSIQSISEKALNQAELGNNEYILDLLEFELLPIIQKFLNETNGEM